MARLIDPRIATALARRVGGDLPHHDLHLVERLRRDLEDAVPRAEELVAPVTGTPTPPSVRWDVIGRGAWAEANIHGMGTMIGPLQDKIVERLQTVPYPVRLAQRVIVSSEVGLLLGYVSRRVLGQYDLLIPEEGARWMRRSGIAPGTALYFVGPNMVETQRRSEFVPDEFALWVALHEVTHRFQFAGVPWLKERFLGLVREYMESVDLDVRSLSGRLKTAARRLAARSLPRDERNPVYLLASEDQKRVLDDIQALMAIVEGHGNFVMDHVGERVIPSFKRMRQVFERRREQASYLQRIFNNVIGLDMKLRQYELGQQFCNQVVAEDGLQALTRLWADPDGLPTLAELKQPRTWLKRVA
ncbi:MAG: zinc-dependent metalloprotease [Actinomycetota bacterium]